MNSIAVITLLAASRIVAQPTACITSWNGLPELARSEAICQQLDASMTSCWVIAEIESAMIDESMFLKVDPSICVYKTAGFRPVRLKDALFLNDNFHDAPALLCGRLPVHAFSFDRTCIEDVTYRPRLPYKAATIMACIQFMDDAEVKARMTEVSEADPMARLIMSDSQKKQVLPENSRKKMVFCKHIPACLFVVEPCPEAARREYIGPVVLSKREASEMLYVLLGDSEYAKRQLPEGFAKGDDIAELKTSLGKDLYYYKAHPEKLKQLREDVDYSLKVATGVLPVSDKCKKGSNSRAQPMNVQDSKKLEGAKL